MGNNRLAQYTGQVQNGYGMEEFTPIPKGTELLCFVESAAWETLMNTRVKPAQEDEFIKVRYRVTGGEWDNRVIFQKLYVLGKVENDADKNARSEEHAWLMLAALDQICLGGAMAKLPHDPEDEDLEKLAGKKVLVTTDINRYTNSYGETVAQNTVRLITPPTSASSRTSSRTPRGTEGGSDEDTGGRERRPRRAR